MIIPKFTPLELFLMTGWVSYILIRLFADTVKLRLYTKAGKITIGRQGKGSKKIPFSDKSNIHIHHFMFGIIVMPLTFVALYWQLWYAPILVGIVMALIGSEVKELVLMQWGQ